MSPKYSDLPIIFNNRNKDDISELHWGAFRLEADLAGGFPAVCGGILDEFVDFEFEVSAVHCDLVTVPVTLLFVAGVHLSRMPAVGAVFGDFHGELVDVPDIAGGIRLTLGLDGAGPDFVFADHAEEDAAVAGAGVAELEAENVIGEVFRRPDIPGGAALIDEDTVLDGPCFLEGIAGECPAGEVFAVEEHDGVAIVVGQALEGDVLEVDGHGRAGVELEGEQAFHHSALGVVVDEFDGLEAV